MERFPSSGSPENKKTKGLSGVGKLARATLAGIAGLGAVAATEIPLVKEAIVPTAEAHESFDAAQEAEAFLDTIEDEDVGIDDARGRHRMRTSIEEKLNVFALACNRRMPHFSAPGERLSGTVTYDMLEAAKRYLQSGLAARDVQGNRGLQILQEIITGRRAVTPAPPPSSSFPHYEQPQDEGNGIHRQPSERYTNPNYRRDDW